MADGTVGATDSREVGATLQAESMRLDRLVSDLLDLARLQADRFRMEPVACDVAELAEAAAVVWADRCRAEGVEFRSVPAGRPLPRVTDPTRLRQVLDGLLENALRVTPAGAPIVLEVRATEPAVIEVRDGGPGLSDDDLRVAFDRGVLNDRYRGVRPVGTGLGLALAAGLVARLGGSIEAGHAAEGGARFSVTLPAGGGILPE
jgi:two-component system sensor histidine kinase BaeS